MMFKGIVLQINAANSLFKLMGYIDFQQYGIFEIKFSNCLQTASA